MKLATEHRKLRSTLLAMMPKGTPIAPCPIPAIGDVVFDWEVRYIAEHLRKSDRREIADAQPQDPYTVLMQSIKASGARVAVYRLPVKRVVLSADAKMPWEPVAVFGMAPWPGLPHKGIPWLLATERFNERGIHVLRFARRMLGALTTGYTAMENTVHAENKDAIRFLRWLGFTVEEPTPWGYKDKLFCRFHAERPKAVNEGPGIV